jgi:hypothetical protein
MPLAALGTIGSLILSALNQQQSAEAGQAQEDLLNKRISDLDAWYRAEGSKDFTQTAEGKATTKRLQNQMKKALESQASTAVKTGATPESKVALQGELSERYGDALSQLSGLSTQRKEGLRRDYTTNMNQLLNQQAGLLQGKQQSSANLAGNIGSALGSLSSVDAGGGFDWLANLFQGSGSSGNKEVGLP